VLRVGRQITHARRIPPFARSSEHHRARASGARSGRAAGASAAARTATASSGIGAVGADRPRHGRGQSCNRAVAAPFPIEADIRRRRIGPASHSWPRLGAALEQGSRIGRHCISVIEPQVRRPGTTRRSSCDRCASADPGWSGASLVPTRSHPASRAAEPHRRTWLSRALSATRPRGFEPLTFGSVDRRGSAKFGSNKPNTVAQVAKKSESWPTRARRAPAGLQVGNSRFD
jgi:hypothetical protein